MIGTTTTALPKSCLDRVFELLLCHIYCVIIETSVSFSSCEKENHNSPKTQNQNPKGEQQLRLLPTFFLTTVPYILT